MNRSIILPDALSLADLQVFLRRAGRVEDGSVRLIATGSVLAAYVAVFTPSGLLDRSPTVLGLRTLALEEEAELDVVVPMRSLLERFARLEGRSEDVAGPVTVTLPIEVQTLAWAAISPPRGGWIEFDAVPAELLESVAKAGIDEVKDTLGGNTGEQIVQRVRAEVWGRSIDYHEHVPAAAAFAAFTLGFLGTADLAAVYETGPWTRVSTTRGHVLVKRPNWSLAG
jgi:hypothetical protein